MLKGVGVYACWEWRTETVCVCRLEMGEGLSLLWTRDLSVGGGGCVLKGWVGWEVHACVFGAGVRERGVGGKVEEHSRDQTLENQPPIKRQQVDMYAPYLRQRPSPSFPPRSRRLPTAAAVGRGADGEELRGLDGVDGVAPQHPDLAPVRCGRNGWV